MTNNAMFLTYFFVAFFFSIQVLIFAFTTDLIHRDSPKSPLYDPKATNMERMTKQFHRSMSRADHIFRNTNKPSLGMQSPIMSSRGEYLMNLYIGTPPYPVWGVADTGSDLSWFQCQPCAECFPEDSPLFDPRKSSTYRKLSCKSRRCGGQRHLCNKTRDQCLYQMHYGDGSFSIGDIAAETLTFGSASGKKVSIPKVVFGCGYKNDGFFGQAENGIIGLGSSNYSIVNQLSNFTNRRFSYCFVPSEVNSNVTSKISFGNSVNMSGKGVVSTPLKSEMFYYLTLESVIVGNKSLPLKRNHQKRHSTNGFGEDKFNMIIDSGTSLTMIPSLLYDDLAWEVRKANVEVQTYTAALGHLKLCYLIKDNVQVPKIKFKFSGAELELSAAFMKVSEEFKCLMIVPSKEGAVLGNMAQQNVLVEYDIDNNKLSFQSTDCTKH